MADLRMRVCLTLEEIVCASEIDEEEEKEGKWVKNRANVLLNLHKEWNIRGIINKTVHEGLGTKYTAAKTVYIRCLRKDKEEEIMWR